MQQILFHIPFTQGWFGMPDGIPLYGFGVMLFLCFVLTAMVWGPRRAVQVGLPKERLQDMAILLFVTGIAGARIVYMIQYSDQFQGKNLLGEFFKIWEGGIVFYGSVIGAVVGFLLFRHFVLRKLGVSVWKLGDAVAPLVALGLAVGRIGCYLNGCCWGQVALPETQPVPLAAEMGQYPLLVCHAREQCVVPPTDRKQLPQVWGVQTSTGFTLSSFPPGVVEAVEKGSAAEAVLQPGDKILKVNGMPMFVLTMKGLPVEAIPALLPLVGNSAVDQGKDRDDGYKFGYTLNADATAAERQLRGLLVVKAGSGELDLVRRVIRQGQGQVLFEWTEGLVIRYPAVEDLSADEKKIDLPGSKPKTSKPTLAVSSALDNAIADWPRWKKSIELEVDRGGETMTVSFTPKTVTLFPTQLYEVVSMGLLILLLLAFQPFRRHDGQVLVLLMLGYGVHRWFNEAIRIEPSYALGMTLSQWVSVGIIAAAMGLELFLRKTQPKLPNGPLPLSYGSRPVSAT